MSGRVVRILDREPGSGPAIEVAGFVIENDVPRPTPRGKKNPLRVAMEALEVGQSFFAPGAASSVIHGIAKLMKAKKFQTAGKQGGIRVWRIE